MHLQAEFGLGQEDALVLRHAELFAQHFHAAQTPRHRQGLGVPQHQGTSLFPDDQKGLRAEKTGERQQERKGDDTSLNETMSMKNMRDGVRF